MYSYVLWTVVFESSRVAYKITHENSVHCPDEEMSKFGKKHRFFVPKDGKPYRLHSRKEINTSQSNKSESVY